MEKIFCSVWNNNIWNTTEKNSPVEFPEELLLNIFSSLSDQDLLVAGLVNRRWRANALMTVYGEFGRFNQIKLHYEEFIKNLAAYLHVTDMTPLIDLKEAFDTQTCFPDVLMHRMNKALTMALKKLTLDDLNKLKNETPEPFKKLVQLETIYKKIDYANENYDFRNKQVPLSQLFFEFIKLGELDDALKLLDKLEIFDEERLVADWIKILVYNQRYEDAIKVVSIKCKGHKKSYLPLQGILRPLLDNHNIRQAIRCAFLLKDVFHEIIAYSEICRRMNCELENEEPLIPFFPSLGYKRSVIPICARLAKYDLDQAILIADDLEERELRDDVLFAIAEAINSSNGSQKMVLIPAIATLISNSGKRKKAMNLR